MRPAALVSVSLFTLTLLVFGRAKGFPFLNYDDQLYVYTNPHVQGGLTGADAAWVGSRTDVPPYVPHPRDDDPEQSAKAAATVGDIFAKTTWPVSAMVIAAEIVSRSRISPISKTSGVWRSAARRASAKEPTSAPTSRCSTILRWWR